MTWKHSMPALAALAPALAPALALAACAADTLAPGDAQLAAGEVLVTELSLDRTTVAPNGTFTATYTIRNTGAEGVRLTTACTALARGVVYRTGAEVAFMGSGSGCYTAIGHYDIPAGGAIAWRWDIRAAIIVEAYPDGRPPLTRAAERGEYTFQAEPNVMMINETAATLPRLSRVLLVQ
jgi:hypothetical protein